MIALLILLYIWPVHSNIIIPNGFWKQTKINMFLPSTTSEHRTLWPVRLQLLTECRLLDNYDLERLVITIQIYLTFLKVYSSEFPRLSSSLITNIEDSLRRTSHPRYIRAGLERISAGLDWQLRWSGRNSCPSPFAMWVAFGTVSDSWTLMIPSFGCWHY